jgi:hypothetical protein
MFRRNAIVLIALALVIALSAAWMPATAVPRQCVIFEGFTQWNCGPCAGWNPTEDAMMAAFTADTVIAIKYHAWWPGANNDIYHLWNVPENTARINMYGVEGVPSIFTNGYLTYDFPFNTTAVRNGIRAEYSVPSPCTIEITALAQGATSVFYSGTITAESSVSGQRLFVALLTLEEHAPPQGTNGETSWSNVFRDMSPDASQGLVLTAGAGQTQEFSGTLNRDADWDVENLCVVAFIQNLGTRQIVQGTHTTVTQNYGMATSTTEPFQRMIRPANEEFTYAVNLQNVGLLDDTYDVELQGDFPAGWTHTIEAPSVPANESEIQVSLSNLETAELLVRLNSNGNPGAVDFAVHVTTPSEPLISAHHDFRIMGGMNILIVDDDEGANFETYFVDAIEPYAATNDLIVGTWDVNRDWLDNSYFNDYDIIVWLTGNSWSDGQTLTALDQLILGDYLTSGGKLFLSGQGIGNDIRTDQFMSDYLHCSYLGNYPQGSSIVAVANDLIADGLDTPIAGGTGAGNQTRQSKLNPLDDAAISMFTYTGSTFNAAVRVQAPAFPSGTFGIVYLAFGFEAIASSDTRNTLMQRSLDWLYGLEPAVEAPPSTPLSFELGQNFPNPFNPETTIPFTLAERSVVTLNVYDILGREVAQLVSGIQEAGLHSVNWNAETVSSGIYFYTLEATAGENTFRSARKLVLMK